MSGYISGRESVFISWSELCNKPGSWMLEECYPEDFSWADPSKLRNIQVFQLLDHWRQREQDGMEAILWNPSCKALSPMTTQTRRRHRSLSPPEPQPLPVGRQVSLDSGSSQANPDHQSGEENFDDELQKILDEDSEDCSSIPSRSPFPQPRPKRLSDLIDGNSCKYFMSFQMFHFIDWLCSTLNTCTNLKSAISWFVTLSFRTPRILITNYSQCSA